MTYGIAANSDDAQQAGTTMTLDGSPLILSAATHWLGFRFTDVNIPVGATITSAYIMIDVTSTTYDTPGGLVMYGQASASPATFTTTASDISNRPRTTANVAWTGSNIGAGSKNSPDITSIINEIINGALGWVYGNPIVIIWDAVAATDFRVRSFESGVGFAQLAIDYTYTPPKAMPPPRRVRTYVRM